MRRLMVLAVVIVCIVVYWNRDDSPRAVSSQVNVSEPATSGDAAPADDDANDTTTSSSGSWGEGHQAGYDWAEEKGISDESDCEAAGDHSNSPSFAEGCKAYVNGESH